jgi:hypothetical protein
MRPGPKFRRPPLRRLKPLQTESGTAPLPRAPSAVTGPLRKNCWRAPPLTITLSPPPSLTTHPGASPT